MEIIKLFKKIKTRLILKETLAGFFIFLIGLILTFVILASYSHFANPPVTIRIILAVILIVIILFLIWELNIRKLLRINEFKINSLINDKYPQFKDSLINAFFLQTQKFGEQESPYLATLYINQMNKKAKDVNPALIVEFKDYKKLYLTFILSLIFFVFFFIYPFKIIPLNSIWYLPSLPEEKIIPQIGDITLEYFYPPYTKLESRRVENSGGQIEGIKGTTVKITALLNKPVIKGNLFTDDGKNIHLTVKEKNIEGKIVLTNEKYYWLEIEDIDGLRNQQIIKYPIKVIEDEKPQVEILAPAIDLSIHQKEEFKITYKIKDDFAITKIFLNWRKNQENKYKKEEISSLPSGIKDGIFDYLFKVGKLNLNPGDGIFYYLEVVDNDTISGPKSGVSKEYYLNIFDYQQIHQQTEQLAQEVSEELFNLLTQQTNTYHQLKDTLNWEDAFSQQEQVKRSFDDLLNLIDKLLEKIAQDPLSDLIADQEYQAMKEQLSYLKENKVESALKKLKEEDEEALKIQEEIIKQLENMSLLAEDLSKYQRMKDVLNNTNQLMNFSSQLLDELGNYPQGLNEEKLAELSQMLNEISSLMQEVQKMLLQMPQQLPEDFVNQDALKTLDFNQMQEIINQLRKSLSENDLENAIKEAKKLLENLSQMMETIQSWAGQTSFLDPSGMMKNTDYYSQQLGEIIQKEKNLALNTENLVNNLTQQMLSEQKKILDDLIKLQQELITKAKSVYNEDKTIVSLEILKTMEKIAQNLKDKDINQAKDNLGKVISDLEKNLTEQLQNPFYQQTKEIKEGEEKIYNFLKNKSQLSDYLTQEQQQLLQEYSLSQKEILDKTSPLLEKFEYLSRQTAQLPVELLENMKQAKQAMGNAYDNLEGFNPNEALVQENQAIYYLSESLGNLQEFQQNLAFRQQNLGAALGPRQMFRPYGQIEGGRFGVKEGYVEIPSAKDYRPPQEFREEILKYLQENYPQIYKESIEKYYQNLTK